MINNAFDMPNQTPPDQLEAGGTAPSIDQVLGFVTEFNENVAIFSQIAGLILENTLSTMLMEQRIVGNHLAIQNIRQDLRALATMLYRVSSYETPSNTTRIFPQ